MLTRAVARGAKRPLVDRATCRSARSRSPTSDAVDNAVRFVKEAGADAVKLEGAGPTLSRVQAIVGAGVPVMGHVGLTPQSATDARRLQGAGPHRREGRAALRGRARARGRRAASRSCSRRCPAAGRGARDRGAARCRRSGSARAPRLRRPGARLARPARPLRGQGAALRQALRRPRRPRRSARSRRTSTTSARAASRRSSTPTRSRTRS